MKRAVFLMLLITVLTSVASFAATIEDHLPLLKPNPTKMGTRFQDFITAHPSAKDLSLDERKPGVLFAGMLSEDQNDGSLVLYGFTDNDLASLTWASKVTDNIPECLKAVRGDIIKLHGPPSQLEFAARMDQQGSIAKVTREVFQSKLNVKCVICLMATSGGIEVFLTDESIFDKHGRQNTRQTYEDAVRAVGDTFPSNSKPSTIVDYLLAARADAQQSQKLEPETPIPKIIDTPSQTPPTVSPKPTPPAEPAHRLTEPPSPLWLWWLVGLALIALVFIANALQKRRR